MAWTGVRKEEDYIGREGDGDEVQGTRAKERPRGSWTESVKEGLRERGLKEDEYVNRAI